MIDTIVNSFDVWTDAQGIKSRTRIKDVENISLEGIACLRELILELAILGKLVPQDPKDEPASFLLTKIKTEREKKDSIKKKKKEGEVYSGKIFNIKIPGWELCKLEDIGDTNIGLTYSPNDVADIGTIVLRSSNIQNGEIELSDIVRVNKFIKENVLVEQGDLLICARNGSKKLVGKCALIRNLHEPMAFGAFMALYRSPFTEYCRIFIESPIYRRNLEGVATTTINQITQENLKNTYIPLPPLAEQKRIVAKVDELMALCDKLEEEQFDNLKTHQALVKTLLESLTQAADADELQISWKRLSSHFDTLFCTDDSIEQLKQAILQLAVMGKLVRQDPEDEPASELLKKIMKEKVRLVDEGKLKKQITPTIITKEEIPFMAPKGWQWVRLGALAAIKGGKRLPAGHSFSVRETPFIYIQVTNMKNGTILKEDLKYISKETQAEISNYTINKEDLYITIAGTIGDVGVVPAFFDGMNLTENAAKIIFHLVNKNWLQKILSSNFLQEQFKEKTKQLAQPKLALHRVESSCIPLCPLLEQNRIVQKIDELFAICESLKDKIKKSQDLKVLLSKSIVEKAVQ